MITRKLPKCLWNDNWQPDSICSHHGTENLHKSRTQRRQRDSVDDDYELIARPPNRLENMKQITNQAQQVSCRVHFHHHHSLSSHLKCVTTNLLELQGSNRISIGDWNEWQISLLLTPSPRYALDLLNPLRWLFFISGQLISYLDYFSSIVGNY